MDMITKTIRVTPAQWEVVVKEAKATRRTLSAMMGLILEDYANYGKGVSNDGDTEETSAALGEEIR